VSGEQTVSRAPLREYSRFVFDLDGTIWLSEKVLPGVVPLLERIRDVGARVVFATNSPNRSRDEIVTLLSSQGVSLAEAEVVTVGYATALHLMSESRADATVFVIGQPGLRRDLESATDVVVLDCDAGGAAEVVIVARDEALTYRQLAVACRAVLAGARFLATGRDRTTPSVEGPVPGGGSLVAAVEWATGVVATAIGKPAAPMMETIAIALGEPGRTLVVGDKLESDIEGARRMGWEGALVSREGPAALPPGAPEPAFIVERLDELFG
jgi:HAD superfamily hydrolase (TIGR01450 family)